MNNSIKRAYATLRVIGKYIDPTSSTNDLRIVPTKYHKLGDKRGLKGTWPQGYWGISSEVKITSLDLSDHITWLVQLVEPAREALLLLQQNGAKVDVFCFLEMQASSGGPSFEPSLLRRLAELNLELGIDIYFVS